MSGILFTATVECHKQSSMSHSGGSLEDQNTERNAVGEGGCKGNKDSTGSWASGHSPSILAENLAAFCLGSGKLSETFQFSEP